MTVEKIVLDENEMSPAYVKSQFDEILAREITALIEIDSDTALLTYNLSTISAIQVAVERDREIKGAKGFPPERYTIESLSEELEEIGLTHDDTLTASLEKIIEQGYLAQDKLGELKAGVSAYTIVGFLDRMFPGMQGIQLVAFVLQMTDEVLSKRKSLEDAKKSFAQTLKKSGVAVTRENAEKKAKEIAEKKSDGQVKAVARKLKADNAKRLALLRFREKMQLSKESGKPTFHFDGGSRIDKVKIRSLFDDGPSREELEAREKARKADEERQRIQEEAERAAELEAQQRTLRDAEEAAKALERKAAELAEKEQELESAKMAAIKLEQAEAELKTKLAEMALKEAELRVKEEQLKAEAKAKALEDEQRERQLKEEEEARQKEEKEMRLATEEPPEKSPAINPDDIEARIAAFESELAMPCPICQTGKVKHETTDTGKQYYVCSNSACRFVSWAKPYHFPCPQCQNSFLVEFEVSPTEKGLKCPRASCTFRQNDLTDPAAKVVQKADSNAASSTEGVPKKKKRLVRRVKRRR